MPIRGRGVNASVKGFGHKVGASATSCALSRTLWHISLGQSENMALSAIRPMFVPALLKWLMLLPIYFQSEV